MEKLVESLKENLKSVQVRLGEPLSEHTTFKIGGPADIFVEPYDMEELSFVLKAVKESGLPLTVLGLGSNVLVQDGGIRGVVVCLSEMQQVKRCVDNTITMGAGFLLKDVSEFACEHGLTGLEFAIGIPGSLGGAVFMNAGAYGGEMKDVVTTVRAVDFEGNLHTYDVNDLNFAYRHSVFHDNHEVIGEVVMSLQPGNISEIKAVMNDLTEKRESKQPLEHASAGSTFKRPPGLFAGTIIDQLGLKGLSIGDAQVSTKHAGFVVNVGHASAKDVLGVIHEVQRRVKVAHNVNLETEVRIIGEE